MAIEIHVQEHTLSMAYGSHMMRQTSQQTKKALRSTQQGIIVGTKLNHFVCIADAIVQSDCTGICWHL